MADYPGYRAESAMTAQRPPLMLETTVGLCKALEEQAEIISQLESRLTPVLAPQAQGIAPRLDSATPAPPVPPLIQEIRSMTEHVAANTRRLRELIGTLEI